MTDTLVAALPESLARNVQGEATPQLLIRLVEDEDGIGCMYFG